MNAKTNTQETDVLPLPDMSALQNAAVNFINTSANVVGVKATTQVFEYLTALMTEEPAFARKLATPSIQAELSKIAASMKGKKWTLTELMAALPGLVKSLNKVFGK